MFVCRFNSTVNQLYDTELNYDQLLDIGIGERKHNASSGEVSG